MNCASSGSSPRDKRQSDRDSLDLPHDVPISPPTSLQVTQTGPYGMIPPQQYQPHVQNHMTSMIPPPQYQSPYQASLNHMDSGGDVSMEHSIQNLDECMMRSHQQYNPQDMSAYTAVTSHNGQNHLELMHDMINSFWLGLTVKAS